MQINGDKKGRMTLYHPECNSQVKVVNKQVAKYLGDFVTPWTWKHSFLQWPLTITPL
jgi:hypothetical protein